MIFDNDIRIENKSALNTLFNATFELILIYRFKKSGPIVRAG